MSRPSGRRAIRLPRGARAEIMNVSPGTAMLAGAAIAGALLATASASAADRPAVPVAAAPVASAAAPASSTHAIRALSVAQFRELVDRQRGHVLVLNLWASWCVPCLKEIPELLRVQQKFAKCDVRVLGLATDDPQELAGAVTSMHAKYFPTFESYARSEGEPDSYASVVDPAWNELMPTTYVLDAQGRVVKRLQGGRSAEEFAKVVGETAGCDAAG